MCIRDSTCLTHTHTQIHYQFRRLDYVCYVLVESSVYQLNSLQTSPARARHRILQLFGTDRWRGVSAHTSEPAERWRTEANSAGGVRRHCPANCGASINPDTTTFFKIYCASQNVFFSNSCRRNSINIGMEIHDFHVLRFFNSSLK